MVSEIETSACKLLIKHDLSNQSSSFAEAIDMNTIIVLSC